VRVNPASFDGVLQVGVITTRDAAALRMEQLPPAVHDIAFSGAATRFRFALLPDRRACSSTRTTASRAAGRLRGLFVVLPPE